jgi:Zn-dependent membrane protease YugP
MVLSIVYVAGLVVFALATLPVEIGASHRALELLRGARLVNAAELAAVRSVLRAAAWTYVVGLLNQVGFFLALIVVAGMAHGVST